MRQNEVSSFRICATDWILKSNNVNIVVILLQYHAWSGIPKLDLYFLMSVTSFSVKLYFDYFVCYYDWTIYEHMINYTSRHLNVSLRTGPGPQNRCQYITDFKSIFIGVTVEVSFGYKHGLKVYFMGYLCANFHAFLQLWNIKNLNNCTNMFKVTSKYWLTYCLLLFLETSYISYLRSL